MNTIAFMTANYVARNVAYHMTEGWIQGDEATQAYFRPLNTFHERFDILLADIRTLGFEALDLWTAHLHPTWATTGHIAIARALLDRHGLQVTSLAGWFGSSLQELEANCRLAAALKIPFLAGGLSHELAASRIAVLSLLQRYDLKWGLENHPEKSAAELLAQLGDDTHGRIGVALDTGWFGTQGYNAAQAILELQAHLLGVHLKDVLAPGNHDTCRYGQGCVPIEACVRALKQIGYAGVITIEHEPALFDPSEDLRANLKLLKNWLAS
jgi:sugar phosphate isomerase/epimerase